jgi:hypothetical protein
MSEQPTDDVPWWRNGPWLGRHLFAENRNKNAHLLQAYNNMHVAWYPDGSGIRDADADMFVLWKRIEASGDDPQWYSYEHVIPVV